jgi:hypothetical protein
MSFDFFAKCDGQLEVAITEIGPVTARRVLNAMGIYTSA